MKAKEKPTVSGPGRGLVPSSRPLWDCGRRELCSGRGKALVLPNMVLETGYKPTYRKRRRESVMTMRVAYLVLSLSLFLPVPFLFLEHKQVAPVAALVLGYGLRLRIYVIRLRAYAVSL